MGNVQYYPGSSLIFAVQCTCEFCVYCWIVIVAVPGSIDVLDHNVSYNNDYSITEDHKWTEPCRLEVV